MNITPATPAQAGAVWLATQRGVSCRNIAAPACAGVTVTA